MIPLSEGYASLQTPRLIRWMSEISRRTGQRQSQLILRDLPGDLMISSRHGMGECSRHYLGVNKRSRCPAVDPRMDSSLALIRRRGIRGWMCRHPPSLSLVEAA